MSKSHFLPETINRQDKRETKKLILLVSIVSVPLGGDTIDMELIHKKWRSANQRNSLKHSAKKKESINCNILLIQYFSKFHKRGIRRLFFLAFIKVRSYFFWLQHSHFCVFFIYACCIIFAFEIFRISFIGTRIISKR